jgi:hypothetical protein
MKMRRGALAVAGLALAISLGLAGSAVSGAAFPIQAGSRWSVLIPPKSDHNCVVLTFSGNHTFRGGLGDAGKWSGSGNKLTITWTSPNQKHYVLKGTYTTTPVKQFTGTLRVSNFQPNHILLIKGIVPNCRR